MKVLVADDEPLARERLVALLKELEGVDDIVEAPNGKVALERALAAMPDVALLDIRMPGMDGLEVARHLATLAAPPAVVFTTAYDQHALAAFEARAVDYLLKPVQRERLAAALERSATLSPATVAAVDARPDRRRAYLSANTSRGLQFVASAEVRYLLADEKYVAIGHPGGELLSEETLKALETEFGEALLRVHRNALVAVAHVAGVVRNRAGRFEVVLDGVDRRLEISRRLLPGVRRRLRGR